MELDDIASVLAQSDFFKICDEEQVRLLAFASERKRFSAGDVIFEKGDMSDGGYVLISGQVIAGDPGDGSRRQRVSERGVVLGEMGLVLQRPRRSTISAATRVELVHVPYTAFAKLMRQYPEMAAKAAERIEHELRDYLAAMSGFASRD